MMHCRPSDGDCLLCRCTRRDGKYNMKIIPESVKQATATPVIVDLIIISKPWQFNLKDISPRLAANIHIWHGTGDLQVGAQAAHTAKACVLNLIFRLLGHSKCTCGWAGAS